MTVMPCRTAERRLPRIDAPGPSARMPRRDRSIHSSALQLSWPAPERTVSPSSVTPEASDSIRTMGAFDCPSPPSTSRPLMLTPTLSRTRRVVRRGGRPSGSTGAISNGGSARTPLMTTLPYSPAPSSSRSPPPAPAASASATPGQGRSALPSAFRTVAPGATCISRADTSAASPPARIMAPAKAMTLKPPSMRALLFPRRPEWDRARSGARRSGCSARGTIQ